MTNFSNLTVEEYLRLNADSIPKILVDHIDGLLSRIDSLEEDAKEIAKEVELREEQIDAAKTLLYKLDNLVYNELEDIVSHKTYKIVNDLYEEVRHDTLFET